MSGYARIHRQVLDHPAFRNEAEALAFVGMVLRASWRPVRVRYKGRAVELKRGQFAVSVRDFAEAMDRDKGWVERLLKRLRAETMIETRAETGVLVITICNYDKYQVGNDERETVRETADETDARQTQDTEQEREIREEGIGSVAKATSPARAPKAPAFPRPDFADPQVWADFLANRKRKGTPNTATAWKRMMADIARLSDDEWPPGRLLEHAAGKGWAGIYDPREDNGNSRNGQRSSNHHRTGSRRADEIDDAAGFLGFA